MFLKCNARKTYIRSRENATKKLTLIVRQGCLAEVPHSTTIQDLLPHKANIFFADRKSATKFLPANVKASTQRYLVTYSVQFVR